MDTKKLYKQAMGAANALREPLDSPMFNPWPLEGLLEFLEHALRHRKAGLRRIYDSGLANLLIGEDYVGFDSWDVSVKRNLFVLTRMLGMQLSTILDKVERDANIARPRPLRALLLSWAYELRRQ